MPSIPIVCSINSLTSLPRSPIKAITLISAVVFFAIIARVVDFPTPEPAKIPTLCPFPIVFKPSIAFKPKDKTSSIGFLSIGLIILALVG